MSASESSLIELLGGGPLATFVIVLVALHFAAFFYWIFKVSTEKSNENIKLE